jgi:hypothetical protein
VILVVPDTPVTLVVHVAVPDEIETSAVALLTFAQNGTIPIDPAANADSGKAVVRRMIARNRLRVFL